MNQIDCNRPENKSNQLCIKDIKPVEEFKCKIDHERKKMVCEFDLDMFKNATQ